MAEKRKILAWLFCFGHWDPANRPVLETIGHDQYLEAFVKSVMPLRDMVEYIYVSSGVTDNQGKTECSTVRQELDIRLKQYRINLPLIEDIGSLVTISTVKNFIRILKETYRNHTPLLYCSRARYELNYFLVGYFAKQSGLALNPKEIVVPLSAIDTRSDSTPEYQKGLLEGIKKTGLDKVEVEEINKKRASFF